MKSLFSAMFAACVVIGSMVLGACSTVEQKVVPLAQATVTKYCEVPEAERLLIRQQVNAAIAPNSIIVTCTSTAAPPITANAP